MIGYAGTEVTGVQVSADGIVKLDISVRSEVIQVSEMIVETRTTTMTASNGSAVP